MFRFITLPSDILVVFLVNAQLSPPDLSFLDNAAKEAKLKELTAGLPSEVQAGIQKLADDKKQAIEAALPKLQPT
uniref:Uncharacterized protein n=1 Tax=Ditylenchus dipsaci TaxID=166011 RepID=A0A915DLH3_9BILA